VATSNDPEQLHKELQGFSDDDLKDFQEKDKKLLRTAHTSWVGRINSWYLSRLIEDNQKETINCYVKNTLLELYNSKNDKLCKLEEVLKSIIQEKKEKNPSYATFLILLFMNPSAYVGAVINLARQLQNRLFESHENREKILDNFENNFQQWYVQPLEEAGLIETTYEKPILNQKKRGAASFKRIVLSYKSYILIKFLLENLENFSQKTGEVIMLNIANKYGTLLVKLPDDAPYQLARGMWGFPTIKITKFSNLLNREVIRESRNTIIDNEVIKELENTINELENSRSEKVNERLKMSLFEKVNERLKSLFKFIEYHQSPKFTLKCYFPLGSTSVASLLITPNCDEGFVNKFIEKVDSKKDEEPDENFIVEKYVESGFFTYEYGVTETLKDKGETKLYFRTLFFFAWQYALELLNKGEKDKCKTMLCNVKKHIDKDNLTKGQFELMVVNNWQFFDSKLQDIFSDMLSPQINV
jgi:hypothetical protein